LRIHSQYIQVISIRFISGAVYTLLVDVELGHDDKNNRILSEQFQTTLWIVEQLTVKSFTTFESVAYYTLQDTRK